MHIFFQIERCNRKAWICILKISKHLSNGKKHHNTFFFKRLRPKVCQNELENKTEIMEKTNSEMQIYANTIDII